MSLYKDLIEHKLLSHCLDSYTQNSNESLDMLIWASCLKKSYQEEKYCSVSIVYQFNDGASSIARVLQKLGMSLKFH